MKFKEAIIKLNTNKAESIARAKSDELQFDWKSGINYVFKTCLNNPELAPTNIGLKTDDAKGAIERWVIKYYNGYNSRISRHRSNVPGTIADPIINIIIQGRLTNLDDASVNLIKYAHRLSMAAENILGHLLEEYLSVELKSKGWYCAWGETVRSVDFCSKSGGLLQIKNRSNSENSSSNKIRKGTSIEKWFRVDALTGKYLWQNLNSKLRVKCSEETFRDFVKEALAYNPSFRK